MGTKLSCERGVQVRALLGLLALVLTSACGNGDDPSSGVGEASSQVQSALLPVVPSADVLGFETTAGWNVTLGIPLPLTSSDVRTQGAQALSVSRPLGIVRLQSVFLSSTNPQLASIERGSALSLDVMLPTAQPNPFWFGNITVFVTALSRGVVEIPLETVALTGLRTNSYNTLRFKIPNFVADALKGATYSDLTLGILLNAPVGATGVYRFDHLRIKSTLLPPRPTSIDEIHGGQSIPLQAFRTTNPVGSQVATSTFPQGIIQVPRSFHTVLGKAGTGTARFEYRLGAAATPVVCTYTGASANALDYVLGSCSSGATAGDLVSADWVRLTVVSADPSAAKTKIQAQITLNPLGDEIVTGMPPVPTYFGRNGSEIAASISAFVEEQRNWNIDRNQLVRLPTPAVETAFVVADDPAHLPPSPLPPNDPPFHKAGRLTNSDYADAGWHVNGSISADVNRASGARTILFDASAGIDAWLLTAHFTDILSVTGHFDTLTPPMINGQVQPTTGKARFCYSASSITSGCKDFNETTGISAELFHVTPSINFLTLNYLFFSVSASGRADILARASGGFIPNGLAFTLTPSAALSVELSGGLALGTFAGGGLFGRGQLVGIEVPIAAKVDARVDPTPGACRVQLDESLTAKAILSSGSGSFGYYVEGGLTCGFFAGLCWRDEEDIFTWPPLARKELEILPDSPFAGQTIDLDPSLCPPRNVGTGAIHYPPNGATFSQGNSSFLKSEVFFTFGDPATGGLIVQLKDQVWTSSDPSDLISATPFTPDREFTQHSIFYGNPGTRTIHVRATGTNNGVVVGSAEGDVIVNVLPNDPATRPGVLIVQPRPGPLNACTPFAAVGLASDPLGLPLTYNWFLSIDEPPGVPATFGGSGANATISARGNLLRLIVTDSAGHQNLTEVPVSHLCTN